MEEDEELEKIKTRKMKELLKGQKENHEGVIAMTSSSFDRFLANTKLPILVDFWADWCMPCRIMAPIMEELARDYQGKVMFGKINVDENPDIARRYEIMSIPHFIIFKAGNPSERIVGAVGRGPLEEALKRVL